MSKRLLIVVDMQNDFIDGSLANPAAQAIVDGIVDEINSNMYAANKPYEHRYSKVILTRDTHNDDYLSSTEGKYLKVEHCIRNSNGWCINEKIFQAARTFGNYEIINKPTFGYLDWAFAEDHYTEIVLVGTCTDICVISNALILKAKYPNTKITVLKDLCAGLSPEKHEAALEVMRSCQVEVK